MGNNSEVKENKNAIEETEEMKNETGENLENIEEPLKSEKIYDQDEVNKLLSEKDEEIASLKDKLLRTHAEFDNYKKRNIKIQEQNKKLAIRNIAIDLIDLNDNLLRASDAALNINNDSLEEAHKEYVNGVIMISKNIEAALEKHGIEEILSINEPFDPNKHEAVEINMSDEVDNDTVTKVHQKGFQLDDFIIRSAKVCVTKPIPKGSVAAETGDNSKVEDNEENEEAVQGSEQENANE